MATGVERSRSGAARLGDRLDERLGLSAFVVGATLRPASGPNELAAGAIGGLVLILAVAGLQRRRAADRPVPTQGIRR